MPSVERIGHRGSPRRLLENTLPSFLTAFQEGADAVELDVHVTVDGVAVVHHDPVLGRGVRPASFRRRALHGLTAEQLGQVELAASGVRLPTLAAVMDAVSSLGRAYVEIKSGSETVVAAVLRAHPGRCAVHSFDHGAIARMRDLAPEIPRGILFDQYPIDVIASMRAAGARDVWPAWRTVDSALVDAVHGEGGRVIPWTVNSARSAEDLSALGVDGLCSDDIIELFKAHGNQDS